LVNATWWFSIVGVIGAIGAIGGGSGSIIGAVAFVV